LEQNLMLLLQVVERLPEPLISSGELALDLALVNSFPDPELAALVSQRGWQMNVSGQLVQGGRRITLRRGCFGSVLQSSNLLLCMAGTAAEQAVGLAKPVLQLAGQGPQFTASFAEAQRRLLGPTVFCAEGPIGSPETLSATAQLALELLERSASDPQLQEQCRTEARIRLGTIGGGTRIAQAIDDQLHLCQEPLST
jgi:uncharacterized protein (TIGR03492 family)